MSRIAWCLRREAPTPPSQLQLLLLIFCKNKSFRACRSVPEMHFSAAFQCTHFCGVVERKADRQRRQHLGRPVAALDAHSSVSRVRDRNGRSGLVKAPRPTILFISPSPAPSPNPDSSQEKSGGEEEGGRERKASDEVQERRSPPQTFRPLRGVSKLKRPRRKKKRHVECFSAPLKPAGTKYLHEPKSM